MTFILIGVPLILIAFWIYYKYYRLDYGVQTWHLFAVRFLGFSGFIFLFIGLFSYIYKEDPNYSINGNEVVNNFFFSESRSNELKTDSATVRYVCDTCKLSTYLYSPISSQLGSKLFFIPVVTVANQEYLLLRTGITEIVLPIGNTKIISDGTFMGLITERKFVTHTTWFGLKRERLEKISYCINVAGRFKLLR